MDEQVTKHNKLCLPKRSTIIMQPNVTEHADGQLGCNMNKEDVQSKIGVSRFSPLSPIGSILKRVRRPTGKENFSPGSVHKNIIPGYNSNVNSPFPKKVRIVAPTDVPAMNNALSTRLQPLGERSSFQNTNILHMKATDVSHNVSLKVLGSWTNTSPVNATSSTNLKTTNVAQDGQFLLLANNNNGIGVDDVSKDNETNLHNVGFKSEVFINRNRRRNRKDFEHWMEVRFQPKVLADAIQSLSPCQKSWVKRTGFGSLLSFKMNEYPQSLSYYIAQNYQHHCSSICVGDVTIPIGDDDVNEVLGLPKGEKSLIFVRSTHTEDLWRSQFKAPDRLGWKITANMVCEAIKKSSDADRLFKLNFLVLMSNVLIEGPTNPYVKQTMLYFAGELDHCSQYNWCQYLISQLKVASFSWNENRITKRFTGSVAFLVYLYMDRVVNGKRLIRRKKPTYIGWSDTLILDRQVSDISNNSVFHGTIALPLRYKDSDEESSFEDNTCTRCDVYESDGEEVDGKCGSKLLYDDDWSHEESARKKKSVVNETNTNQVPRYVIDQLQASVDELEAYQKKCMMYLMSAKDIFSDNHLLNNLESKFVRLVKESNQFVVNKLGVASVNLSFEFGEDKATNEIIGKSSEKISLTNTNAVVNGDDMCLSKDDWLYIDSLSDGGKSDDSIAEKLFNSMESQSKTLSLCVSKPSPDFKTPVAETLFKVPIDATIPSFNLGIDVDTNVSEFLTDRKGRPVRDRRVADIRRSPYIDRFTSINGKYYRKEETDLWNWLHANKNHPNRILFKSKYLNCYKVDFQSMFDGEMVLTSAFDAWSCFLNSQECLRAPNSPMRLFCYTETTLGTLNAFNEGYIQKKYEIFKDNMEHILKSSDVQFKDVDLVFFPIYQHTHYYVVCYNLKNPSIEILDNSKTDRSVRQLYGQHLIVLQKHMIQFLRLKNYRRVNDIERCVPERLNMYWQTQGNGIDCAIFAMRHMETYFGGGSRTWESKFAVQSYTQGNQISRLRLLFTFRMLSSELNSNYSLILEEIKDPSLELKHVLLQSQNGKGGRK